MIHHVWIHAISRANLVKRGSLLPKFCTEPRDSILKPAHTIGGSRSSPKAELRYHSGFLTLPTRSQSLSKMLRLIPDDPISSDWLFSCNSALTLRAPKMSKAKNLKRFNFGQSVFFKRCRMRSAAKRMEQSLGYRYLSKMEWVSLRPQHF